MVWQAEFKFMYQWHGIIPEWGVEDAEAQVEAFKAGAPLEHRDTDVEARSHTCGKTKRERG